MATFQFTDKDNKQQTVTAQNANQALQTAKNIAPDSGVIEVKDLVAEQPKIKPVQIPVTSQPLDRVETFDDILARTQAETDRRIQESRESTNDILNQLLQSSESDSQQLFEQSFRQQGGQRELERLQDESTRLAELQGKFRSLKERVSGSAGQTKILSGAQISEIGRQEAVEVGNQALLVQARQGNVATARQIAMDTVDLSFKDRQIELQALGQQIDVAMTFANQDQQRALNREQTVINNELRELEETRTAIDTAIMTGEASVEEMQQLTNPDVSDRDKRKISQLITARTTRNDREYEKYLRSLKILQMDESILASRASSARANRDLKSKEEQAQAEEDAENTARVEKAMSLKTLGQDLKGHPGLAGSIGPNPLYRTDFGTSLVTGYKQDFIATLDVITSRETLDAMEQLKGTPSDKDAEIAMKAIGKIRNRDIKESDWIEALDEFIGAQERIERQFGLTDEQASYYYDIDTSDISEINGIYGVETTDQTLNPANYY